MLTWWRLRSVEARVHERRRRSETRRGHGHGYRVRGRYQAYRGHGRLSHRELQQTRKNTKSYFLKLHIRYTHCCLHRKPAIVCCYEENQLKKSVEKTNVQLIKLNKVQRTKILLHGHTKNNLSSVYHWQSFNYPMFP